MRYNTEQIGSSRARYLPFGDLRTTPTNVGRSDRFFTGHKHNEDLGLIYMNARYDVPGMGRFVSADVIVPDAEDPQSLNRYSYVRNNPVNFSDPTGHRECGALEECSDPLPHTSAFQEALLRAWIYREDNFTLPFEGKQNMTQRFSYNHDGIDWSGEFTVQAPASGTVIEAGPDSPAGMWRIGRILRDESGNRIGTGEVREWSVFSTNTEDEGPLHVTSAGGLLEPERLLATGEWEDLQPGWSHTQGTIIKIDHGHNLETIYYHTNPSAETGRTVEQGDELGVTANNGWSSGTHLHYTLQFNYSDKIIKLNPLNPPSVIQHLLAIQ